MPDRFPVPLLLILQVGSDREAARHTVTEYIRRIEKSAPMQFSEIMAERVDLAGGPRKKHRSPRHQQFPHIAVDAPGIALIIFAPHQFRKVFSLPHDFVIHDALLIVLRRSADNAVLLENHAGKRGKHASGGTPPEYPAVRIFRCDIADHMLLRLPVHGTDSRARPAADAFGFIDSRAQKSLSVFAHGDAMLRTDRGTRTASGALIIWADHLCHICSSPIPFMPSRGGLSGTSPPP